MDILREINLQPLVWFALCLGWSASGTLILHRFFRLQALEELFAGFGLGMSVYLFLCNLLGHFLPAPATFGLPVPLMVLVGIFGSRKDLPRYSGRELTTAAALFLAMLPLGALFFAISSGLSLNDEFLNLPMISQLGQGIIPPTYLSQEPYGYHYGFQLLGASMMSLGGFLPWSAFDAAKSLVWAYAIVLWVLVAYRWTGSWLKGTLAGLILVLVGGNRYLVMLFPGGWLARLDGLVQLVGSSAVVGVPFSQALHLPWPVDGGPPGGYLFGFLNGIYQNMVLAHSGNSTLSLVLLLLFWILYQRERSNGALVVQTVLLAFWALVYITSYGLFVIGTGQVGIALLLFHRSAFRDYLSRVLLPGLLSVPLVVFQGGFLTDRMFGAGAGVSFLIKPIPSLESAHLGALALTDPLLLLVCLCEIGLVVLFLPWILSACLRRFKQGEWIYGVFGASSLVGFLLPFFIIYTLERDSTRFTGYAVGLWLMILTLLVLDRDSRRGLRILGGAALLVSCVGGVVDLVRELPAAAAPLNSYYVQAPDSALTRRVWGTLPRGCVIYDPNGFRAVAVTGCATRLYAPNSFEMLPSRAALDAHPTLANFKAQGYTHLYVDEYWLVALTHTQKDDLFAPCTKEVARAWSEDSTQVRILVDIRACPGP